jgi:hyperosmotically inducible periplasmic protein
MNFYRSTMFFGNCTGLSFPASSKAVPVDKLSFASQRGCGRKRTLANSMQVSTNDRQTATGRIVQSVSRHVMKNILTVLLLASTAVAQTQDQATKPDNTKKNATEQTTAEQQGGSAEDRGMTKNIRREMVKNDSLSTMAKNIKVITVDGMVTLRGPVHSEQEKAAIASIAEKIAGKGKVTNQLEIKKK